MEYLFVKGKYVIKGKRPDGDTIAFKPENPYDLYKLRYRKFNPELKSQLEVNIRLEGCDALETHYRPQFWFEELHQNTALAEGARNFMLDELGFDSGALEFGKDGSVKSQTAPIEGFIAIGDVDIYGRVVAFVFSRETKFKYATGKYANFTAELCKQSVNCRLVEKGLAYPAFYSTLPSYIRDILSDLAKKAKRGRKGVWEKDCSENGCNIFEDNFLVKLQDEYVMFPKLFRRLSAFLLQNPNKRAFYSYLYDQEDSAFILSKGHFGEFPKFISFDKETGLLKLRYAIEDLVIIPKR